MATTKINKACPHCPDTRFQTLDNLLRHYYNHHPDDEGFQELLADYNLSFETLSCQDCDNYSGETVRCEQCQPSAFDSLVVDDEVFDSLNDLRADITPYKQQRPAYHGDWYTKTDGKYWWECDACGRTARKGQTSKSNARYNYRSHRKRCDEVER